MTESKLSTQSHEALDTLVALSLELGIDSPNRSGYVLFRHWSSRQSFGRFYMGLSDFQVQENECSMQLQEQRRLRNVYEVRAFGFNAYRLVMLIREALVRWLGS